jgi:uncharacterized protein involved in exopolysaccharide biosynthesis
MTQAEDAMRESARPRVVSRPEDKKEAERPSDKSDKGTDAKRPTAPAATAEERQAAANELRRSRPDVPAAQGLADPAQLDLSNPFVNPVYQTLQFQIAMSRAQLAGLERERRQIAGAAGGDKGLGQFYRGQLAVERLENNYALAKRVYSELAVRYEQSRAESVGNMVQLQIVDPAMPPDGPMPRKRVETAAVGLAGGFFLGALIAIFATPKEPETVLPAGTGRVQPRT